MTPTRDALARGQPFRLLSGGVGSFISETGSWAVLAAVVFAVAALLLARKAPWPPLVVLLAFGWQLETAHASPHGPIAFALLIVAAIWLWWEERKAAHRTFTAEDLRG